jgi:hypothetical protein
MPPDGKGAFEITLFGEVLDGRTTDAGRLPKFPCRAEGEGEQRRKADVSNRFHVVAP